MAEMDIYGNIINIRRARPDLPDTRNTPPPRYTYTPPPRYTYTSSFRNWWNRLNNGVIGIGNWLAEYTENITEWVVSLASVGAIIGLLRWIFGVFADDGFFFGILSIFGASIMGSIIFAIIGIAGYVVGFILLGVRFMFWNIYSLLIALSIVATLTFASFNASDYNHNSVSTEQYDIPQTAKYTCTARVLNVRDAPNVNSKIIGSLKANQVVEVYETSNGFAKIKYGTRTAYVSTKYIKKY